MKRQDFRYLDRQRVRWSEVDLQRIVFNGHYLMYFDTAVAGYWRAMALPYHDTMAALQGDFYAKKAGVEFHASARFEDLIDTGVRIARMGNSSMTVECAVFRGEQLLVSGELLYVFANPETQKSRPIPQPLREVIEAFEAGDPMLRVRTGNWGTIGPQAAPLRHAAFVAEQGVPAELEADAHDADALHALACNRFGVALGTGRLVALGDGRSRIGRMAVLGPLRNCGIGRPVLQVLVDAARARGDREVVLSAQVTALSFYHRFGFEPTGVAYIEAGLTHQDMRMAL